MDSKKKRKIAMVFTGAVSLGSFEAGVAYEIVKHIQERGQPDLEVDVIVGTSAGALTGAVMALTLAFGTDPDILKEAWLSVKLEDLLRLSRGDRSLLSSSKVEQLIAKYINPPVTGAEERLMYKSPVELVVVVTNLDGVKYQILRSKSSEFAISAIGYEDTLRFRVDRDFSEWERLRMAVRASSAYPGAFEHKSIARDHKEYKRVAKYNFLGVEEKSFHYSDGGIVNNQPLNRAIEVVSEMPVQSSADDFERVFLVVDPAPPRGEDESMEYGMFDVINKAVWSIPRNQTLYKDLLLLEKVNRRIGWKNSFITAMADIWDKTTISSEKAQTLNRLCAEISDFKGKQIMGTNPVEYLKAEEKRIRNAYRGEIERVTNADSFIKYCFLFEQVADLRNKHELSVEMVSPLNAGIELAGVIFGNFGGFLDPSFMKHDFNVGRTYGRRWLDKELGLQRLVQYREKSISLKDRRKFLQMFLDNSVPVLFEEVGPRFFGGPDNIVKKQLGLVNFAAMFVLSLAKYVVRKAKWWLKKSFR